MDTFSYTYDGDGNILTASNSQGTYTLSYDNDGRVTNVTEPFGVSLAFIYDADANRTQVSDSFGGAEYSSYNSVNVPVSRTFVKGGVAISFFNESYDRDLQLTSVSDYGGRSACWGCGPSVFGSKTCTEFQLYVWRTTSAAHDWSKSTQKDERSNDCILNMRPIHVESIHS